jgi:hypothetical protein
LTNGEPTTGVKDQLVDAPLFSVQPMLPDVL